MVTVIDRTFAFAFVCLLIAVLGGYVAICYSEAQVTAVKIACIEAEGTWTSGNCTFPKGEVKP